MNIYHVSYFGSLTDKNPRPITVEELFTRIREPHLNVVRICDKIRKLTDKKEIDKLKLGLSMVTVSGIFEGGHLLANMVMPTKLMQVDFDGVENLDEMRENMTADPHTLLCFLSPSGKGLKAIAPYSGDHSRAWHGLAAYYKEQYGVEMDENTKNLNRLLYQSHDPECFYNPMAQPFVVSDEPWEKPKPKQPAQPIGNYRTAQAGSVGADVEKVIDQICAHRLDITGDYKSWLKIGFALASEFGEGGRNYYHAVSHHHADYDRDQCNTQYDKILKDTGSKKSTIAAFFGIAKDYGIDIRPAHLPEKKAQKTAKAANYPLIDTLMGDDETAGAFDVTGWNADAFENEGKAQQSPMVQTPDVDVMDEEEPEPEQEQEPEELPAIPETLEALMRPIDDSEEPMSHNTQHGFFIENSAYWVNKEVKWQPFEISNFCMEYLFHFDDGTKNTKRLVKIQRNTGEISIFEMSDEETKLDKFKTIIRSKACSFRGTANHYECIFTALSNNERKAISITQVGYNSEFDLYALSDAVFYKNKIHTINEIGIINVDGHTFHLPAHSLYNKGNAEYINDRRIRFMPGKLDFETWSRLIFEAYGVNGAIGICFVIQCLFRDVIFQKLNFFPFLFLFGQAGVGKSTYIDLLLRLWGEKDPGVSVKGSTPKAVARTASQRKNAMIFMKEYDNTIDNEFENAFKRFYDGLGYATARTSNDNKTNTWLVDSGIIIDGNYLPTKSSAFFDRNIVLTFEQNKFTAASTDAFRQLNEAADYGFGNVLIEILGHRETYIERIRKAYDFVYSELRGFACEFDGVKTEAAPFIYKGVNISETMPERTIKHLAFIISAYTCLIHVLKFPFGINQITAKVLDDALEKNEMMTEINEVSLFWDSLNYTINVEPHRVCEGKQYARDLYDKIFYVRVNEVYPVYCDYCKRSNITFADKHTLIRLLTSDNYTPFVPGEQKGRGKAYTKAGLGSCYRFRWTEDSHGHKFIGDKEIKL